tara:strand:+ start:1193 stop:1519 length:327 start_codon:yes stop_codon:yes gene_type:complete
MENMSEENKTSNSNSKSRSADQQKHDLRKQKINGVLEESKDRSSRSNSVSSVSKSRSRSHPFRRIISQPGNAASYNAGELSKLNLIDSNGDIEISKSFDSEEILRRSS